MVNVGRGGSFPADFQGECAPKIQELIQSITEQQVRGSKELMAAWKDAQQGVRKHLIPLKLPETLWRKAPLLSQPTRRTISGSNSSPSAAQATHRLIDFMPEEIARQIDLAEHRCFVAIDIREFLRQAHNKPDAKTRAPNLLAYIARFEKVCGWMDDGMLP